MSLKLNLSAIFFEATRRTRVVFKFTVLISSRAGCVRLWVRVCARARVCC